MSPGGAGALAGLALMAAGGLSLILTAEDRAAAPVRVAAPGAGASYRTAIFSNLTARNPWSRYGPNTTVWNSYGTAGTHPTLFGYTTQRFDWVPVLAADLPGPLEPDPARGLWRSRVVLKPGLGWSDGTPITAHDVAFTFRAIAALGASRPGGNFASFAPEDLPPTADHGLDLRRPRHPRRPRGRLGPGPSGGEGPRARPRNAVCAAYALRPTKALISRWTGGRPPVGRPESLVQYSRKRRRCHRRTVSGVTIMRARRHSAQTLAAAAQKRRSVPRSEGREIVRL